MISFEVFPPRTPEGELRLWDTLDRLAPLQPGFVSVTCGAGGSAKDATIGVLNAIAQRTTLTIAGHLTCVGRSRADTAADVARYWEAGVRHIVALRGDVPAAVAGAEANGRARFEPHPDGHRSSIELVAAIRRQAPVEISVAAYPEPHPDSVSASHDLDVLARKADAGATRAITQFCFDTDAIVALRERMAGAGIGLRVVPGILLATDFDGVARMAARCGASLPDSLAAHFRGLEEDQTTRKLLGAIVAAEQVERLRREGFEDFHFYTLNQGELAPAVSRLLGVRSAA
ncbi:MAG: methylenetetrahydrofolate reductase [Conexibacteraceae bacterium]|nr:methylenetetrahydrofolate reductase [Conexibacteraceae bacterium]